MARLEQYILDESLASMIKNSWERLRSYIAQLFSSETDDLVPGDIVHLTIKTSKLNEASLSGAESSIKGNYNEVLVCQMIFQADGKFDQVVIDKAKYAGVEADINTKVKEFHKRLKSQPNHKEVYEEIYKGSQAMATYLIGQARRSDCIIHGIYLDNLSFQRGSDQKADIGVELEKFGEMMYDLYSLKLYRKSVVTLYNPTPVSLVRNLLGAEAEADLKRRFKSHEILGKLITKAKESNKLVQIGKKQRLDRDVLAFLRTKRAEDRIDINPIVADTVYAVMMDYYKQEFNTFAFGILKCMGLTDSKTKIMLVITQRLAKGLKISLIDKHPELNLNNIEFKHKPGSTSIRITDSLGKIILEFHAKEGEAQKVAVKTIYNTKDAVDMEPYADIAEVLGL